MSEEEQGFLTRWSRRKAAARQRAAAAEAAPPETAMPPHAAPHDVPAIPPGGDAALKHADAAPDARRGSRADVPEAAAELPLPPVETLQGLASDYRAFFRGNVDQGLQRAALKKLFSDPHFNQMDGLDVYIDDYGIPDPIPPEMLADLKHARGLLFDEPAEEATDEPVDTAGASDVTDASSEAAPVVPDVATEAAAPVAEGSVAGEPSDDDPAPGPKTAGVPARPAGERGDAA